MSKDMNKDMSGVVLITGAGGQLGREMRNVALKSQRRFIFADAAELDITDGDAVAQFVKDSGVEVIVNCAAYTNVDRAEQEPERAELVNNIAVRNMAQAAKSVGALLIHISTDYVFDGRATEPYRESDRTAPIGVYGATKRRGEEAIEQSGCRYIIIRTSWLFSTYGNNFVRTMLRLMQERETISVVADQTGSPTYAADLAEAIAKILQSEECRAEQQIYHYSSGGTCTWYEMAVAICEMSGNMERCRVVPITSEEYRGAVERPKYSVLDTTKIAEVFGVERPGFVNGLRECVQKLVEQLMER